MTVPDSTHFLFIDNDITWDPVDIFKLLLADKDLIGGIYPLKSYEWNKLLKDSNNPKSRELVDEYLTEIDNKAPSQYRYRY